MGVWVTWNTLRGRFASSYNSLTTLSIRDARVHTTRLTVVNHEHRGGVKTWSQHSLAPFYCVVNPSKRSISSIVDCFYAQQLILSLSMSDFSLPRGV